MIDELSIVETDKVIHTVETDMVKLVVEIECFGMSFNEFDKETGSSDGLQPKQTDLSCFHALNEPHLHEIHVVPSKHEADQFPQNLCDTPLITQQPQAEFPQLDSGLVVPSFLPEHLRIQETKLQFKMTGLLFNKFKGDRVRVLLGEGHMTRQCTKPKRPMNSAWFKEKMLLVQAQEFDEDQLAFLADPEIADGQDTQTTIIHNAAFQTDDLNAYDFDCDDISSVKAVLMANLSSYGSDVLSEVP
ncbi:hypothetical protein Tco_0574301 [Tanacetum coccineum]